MGVEGPHARQYYQRQCKAFSLCRNRLSRKRHFRSPLLRQILPTGIHGLDQNNLLRPPPPLELLLAIDRFENIIETLPVDPAITLVFAGEAFDFASFVLKRSHVQVVGHSYVESARAAGNDVDPVLLVVRHAFTSYL